MSIEGTVLAPSYLEGPVTNVGDVHLCQRFFTYSLDAGLVAGKTFNIMFTIDRPAQDVWPYFKDFNPWQNAYDHYYSGVVGDLEGRTFRISSTPTETGPHQYKVLRVIPEHLITLIQPPSDEQQAAGLSPDCHVFMLNEHGGKTLVTILMEHASISKGKTVEEALDPWRQLAKDSQWKWQEIFIPTLKKLVEQGR